MKKLTRSEGSVREAQRIQEQLETARSTGDASMIAVARKNDGSATAA